jgi:hypothetical protein
MTPIPYAILVRRIGGFLSLQSGEDKLKVPGSQHVFDIHSCAASSPAVYIYIFDHIISKRLCASVYFLYIQLFRSFLTIMYITITITITIIHIVIYQHDPHHRRYHHISTTKRCTLYTMHLRTIAFGDTSSSSSRFGATPGQWNVRIRVILYIDTASL